MSRTQEVFNFKMGAELRARAEKVAEKQGIGLGEFLKEATERAIAADPKKDTFAGINAKDRDRAIRCIDLLRSAQDHPAIQQRLRLALDGNLDMFEIAVRGVLEL
jgi:hypothetical protein